LIFLIVLFLFNKFAWKPLLKAIEKRETTIENSLSAAKAADLKLSQLAEEQKSIVELAKQEKLNLMKEGLEQRDKIIQAAQIKAKEEADRIIEEAKKRLK
jgi:F-type H+-transporting ATPase subunit b